MLLLLSSKEVEGEREREKLKCRWKTSMLLGKGSRMKKEESGPEAGKKI